MKLTFDDCVKLILIYFAIKTGLPIFGVMVSKILDVLIMGKDSEFHKYKREKEIIAALNSDIANLEKQIEEQKAKNEIKAKKIGFVSNNLENS